MSHHCLRGSAERGGACLLVASSGGHLLQLVQLREAWSPHERHWVTFDRPDARSLLHDEQVTYAYHPTNRNVKNLVRNLVLGLRLIRRVRPRAVVTTGAGVAIPFALAGRLFGARVVYIESMARITQPSLTGRLIHPLAHDFFVQWPDLVPVYRKSRWCGSLFDLP